MPLIDVDDHKVDVAVVIDIACRQSAAVVHATRVRAGLRADLTSGVLTLSSAETQRVHTIVLPEQFKKS